MDQQQTRASIFSHSLLQSKASPPVLIKVMSTKQPHQFNVTRVYGSSIYTYNHSIR